jgi:hypothetical protein
VERVRKPGTVDPGPTGSDGAELDRRAGFDLVRIFAGVPEQDASVNVRRFNNGFAVKVGEGWASSYRVIVQGKAGTMHEAIATARCILYRRDEEAPPPVLTRETIQKAADRMPDRYRSPVSKAIEERVVALVHKVADERHPEAWPKPWLVDRFLPRLRAVVAGQADPGYPDEQGEKGGDDGDV